MSKWRPNRVVEAPANDRARLDKAMQEGRFQTALELAKQIFKKEPTPENRQRLVSCYLGRAKQLRDQGSLRDAAGVLNAGVEHAGNDPALIVPFAEELAHCGDVQRGIKLLEWLPEPRPANRVLILAADAALQRGAAGRELLPEALRADFDRVRGAFQHLAANEDAAAKEAIQGIGLTSPFLEWKLLLRGLMAYYESDDERAIDNWSRLDATRLPARLAAPFRFQCDSAFAAAQSPAAQQALRRQVDRLTPDPARVWLRGAQRVAHESSGDLDAVFREVKSFLPTLKAQNPNVVARLARCLYWDIIDHGFPEDLERYERLFGRPADDPRFNRVNAMGLERSPEFIFANDEWREFEKVVADSKQLTEPERTRARAMIWLRMGRNADRQEDLLRLADQLPDSPFREKPDLLPRPNPSAESCFRRAIELAPDWLDPHTSLVESLHELPQRDRTIVAALELLQRFPEHLPTLELLADAYLEAQDTIGASELLARALAINPLNRELRTKLGIVRRRAAMTHAAEGQLDLARAELQAALDLLQDRAHVVLDAALAACEFKAGNAAQAEELLQQAISDPASRPLVEGWMFGQAQALNFPKPLKKRFEQPFKALLDLSQPTPEQATSLARLFSIWDMENFTYHGSKSHLKKALTMIERTLSLPYPEALVEELGGHLLSLKAGRLLKRFTQMWARQFPKNPWPLYFEMEACMIGAEERWPLWRLQPLAKRAQRLAQALPAGPGRDRLLAGLDRREQQFKLLNPMSALFDRFQQNFDAQDDWEDFVP